MFDFENLDVYVKSKELNHKVQQYLRFHKSINTILKNQLRRASISVVINIAEGSGKFSHRDKRNFYTIARGSVYECVALFDLMKDDGNIEQEYFQNFYKEFETVSKMLLGLIKSQE